MIIGVPKETFPGERRVALAPDAVPKLIKAGLEVLVEPDAGAESNFPDAAYKDKGAKIEAGVASKADLLLKVRGPSTQAEAQQYREGTSLVAFLAPHANLEAMKALAERKVTCFAMELIPRTTRAQSMDALSSMSNLAGYKAVLLGAGACSKAFPLLMTAAGTVAPAKVFVIGAGVAGLQAIATAKRLGALVEAYDTRPVVKEQVVSVGAKFVELALETKDAQDKGGYAKEQSDEFYRKQQELMTKHVTASDVVVTTAQIPGKKAPVLITQDAVKRMKPGSSIVDLAAESGGNCELTEAGKEVVKHGVTIIGHTNLPSMLAPDASQLYSRNTSAFLLNMIKEGKLNLDLNDEIIKGALLAHNGEILHEPTRAAMSAKGLA